MHRILAAGRYLFAAAIGAFGVQHLIYLHAPDMLGFVPPYSERTPLGACLVAALLLIASASIANGVESAVVSQLLGVGLLLDFVGFHVPRLAGNIESGNIRTGAFETLAMAAIALMLSALPPTRIPARRTRFNPATAAEVGRYLFAVSLAVFGIQHFMYLALIASLIPAWMPAHVALAWFTGGAFLAAVVGIMSRRLARTAGTLLAAMFLLWVVLLHGPRVAHAPNNGDEWASMLVALCMGGGGLVVAMFVGRPAHAGRRAPPGQSG